jgi:hypothetical protein
MVVVLEGLDGWGPLGVGGMALLTNPVPGKRKLILATILLFSVCHVHLRCIRQDPLLHFVDRIMTDL